MTPALISRLFGPDCCCPIAYPIHLRIPCYLDRAQGTLLPRRAQSRRLSDWHWSRIAGITWEAGPALRDVLGETPAERKIPNE